MAVSILTPNTIWSDFTVAKKLETEAISESHKEGITISRFYLHGFKVESEEVKIYCALLKKNSLESCPAIMVLQDFIDGADETLAFDLAKKGYATLVVDIAGKYNDREFYTVYPECIEYANYNEETAKKTSVEGEVKETCWYIWSSVLRYAMNYLNRQDFVKKIGAIGIGRSATSLWQAAAMSNLLSAVVFVGNAGWQSYKNYNKFGEFTEPNFSDEELVFHAGIEPQVYAPHISCATLLLSATNSSDFDIDRAADTLSYVPAEQYSAINYSVGSRDTVNNECYNDALMFFANFLADGRPSKKSLPSEISIKCEMEGGSFNVEVIPLCKEVRSIDVYASEEFIAPEKRCWRKAKTVGEGKKGQKYYRYTPYYESGIVFFFAKVVYENGFVSCSNIIAKKFLPDQIKMRSKYKILYTSRFDQSGTSFFPATENRELPHGIDVKDLSKVVVKSGPMGLHGIGSNGGLLTFKTGAKKYIPSDDSILMFDVYLKGSGIFTVKLIVDYFGSKTEYVARQRIVEGEFWQNVKFTQNNFKTVEGRPLKSYAQIEAVEFDGENEFLINNVLWL